MAITQKINGQLIHSYARALFALALKNNYLDEWAKILNELAVILQLKELRELSLNPRFSLQKRLEILVNLCDEAKIFLPKEFKNLIHLLLQKKHLEILPYVANMYKKMRQEYSKILEVKVVAAEKLSDEEQQELIDNLARRYKYSIDLKQYYDPSLIGGAVIYIKDKNEVIDGSVRSQLQNLQRFLQG